jgi:quercetin dioxygenase-like cupin family protein
MRNTIALAGLSLAVGAASLSAQAPATSAPHADALTWVDGPPALPKGGQMAILTGDPRQPGPFTLRSKLPAGYFIPPHWHPTAEHVTVISGELSVGMGDKLDPAAMQDMKAGSFAVMAPEMRHYVRTKTEVILQVHGTGPFTITYVNPADDPRQAAAK